MTNPSDPYFNSSKEEKIILKLLNLNVFFKVNRIKLTVSALILLPKHEHMLIFSNEDEH